VALALLGWSRVFLDHDGGLSAREPRVGIDMRHARVVLRAQRGVHAVFLPAAAAIARLVVVYARAELVAIEVRERRTAYADQAKQGPCYAGGTRHRFIP
jgi:hypothetical protein